MRPHHLTPAIVRTWLGAAVLAGAAAASAQSSSIGLSTVRAQRFGNDNLSGFYTPQTSDLFAYSLAAGDFDGDGDDDLATGMPFDNGLASSPVNDSGSVVVRYSTAGSGLTTNPSQVYLRQQGANLPAADEHFGWSLAACDFNADGKDDLAVSAPEEDYLGKPDSGIVHVYYGTNGGLQPSGGSFFAESTPGVPGDVEDYDRFGWTLACGDFDGDGFDDLAVGVPQENWGHWSPTCPPGADGCGVRWGMVIVVPGGSGGLVFSGASYLDQGTDGIAGDPENEDEFGWSLAAGDFDADGLDDLAIGVPGEDDNSGTVQVAFGSPSGPRGLGSLSRSETAIGGLSEAADRFGETLAAGDFDGDGVDDLAIGVPYEDFAFSNCGQVNVLYGAAGGFDQGRTQFFSEQSIFGTGSESDDSFGYALAVGDFDQDGLDDLAVSHPGESVAGPQDGAVTVLMGSFDRLDANRRRQIVAGVEGFPGDLNQHAKYFGFSLASGDFDADGHADLAIGVPYENEGGIADVGAETVLYGALFADGVETGNTNFWSQNVSSPYGNRIAATAAAKLGPASSRVGLQVDLFNPSLQRPATATYVRVGPDKGFANEQALRGSFFVDPQPLTMSSAPGANVFSMLTFTDAVGGTTMLTFDLNRNDSVGGWAILATYYNQFANALQFAGGAGFALANDPNGHNNRIDFEWRAGNPGHLTMWKTRYLNGAPDGNGTQLLFSVDLPGAGNATINDAFAGMVSGQDKGTYGSFYLDEISFRR